MKLIVIPSFDISDNEYWDEDNNILIPISDSANKIDLGPIIWKGFNNMLQNLEDDKENNNNIIIEQEYLIVFIPDQPK